MGWLFQICGHIFKVKYTVFCFSTTMIHFLVQPQSRQGVSLTKVEVLPNEKHGMDWRGMQRSEHKNGFGNIANSSKHQVEVIKFRLTGFVSLKTYLL